MPPHLPNSPRSNRLRRRQYPASFLQVIPMSDAFPSDPYPGIAVPPPFGTPFEVRKALETMRADAVAKYIAGTAGGALRARRRAFRHGLGGGLLAGLLLGVGGGGAAWWLQQAAPPTEPPVRASTALTPVAPAPAAFSASDAAAALLVAREAPAPDASAAPPGEVGAGVPGSRSAAAPAAPAANMAPAAPAANMAPAGVPPAEAGKAVPARRAGVAAAGKQGASNGRRTSTRAASSAAVGPAASIHRGAGWQSHPGSRHLPAEDVAYAASDTAFELRGHAPLLGQ